MKARLRRLQHSRQQALVIHEMTVASFSVFRHVGGITCCSSTKSTTSKLLCLEIYTSRNTHSSNYLEKRLVRYPHFNSSLFPFSIPTAWRCVLAYINDAIAPHVLLPLF